LVRANNNILMWFILICDLLQKIVKNFDLGKKFWFLLKNCFRKFYGSLIWLRWGVTSITCVDSVCHAACRHLGKILYDLSATCCQSCISEHLAELPFVYIWFLWLFSYFIFLFLEKSSDAFLFLNIFCIII